MTRWLRWVTLLFAALCLAGLFSGRIADTDFWWHLKTGQYIAQHHTLPVRDPFAYTTPQPGVHPAEDAVRQFNLTHEWLSQVLMYTVYRVAGFPGIILVRIFLLAAFCGLAGFVAARLSKQFYAGIAATCATAAVMTAFVADRPGIISFVGIALFVTILEMRRAYWALPLLAMLWANCHGGFFLGWVVLLAYCAETLWRKVRKPEDRRLWVAAACAILVSGVNPNGFRVVSTLIAYRQSPMTANLIEWMPPKLWGPPYAFDILLYGAILTAAFSWRRVRVAHWILLAVFGAASLMAFRNVPLVGFFGPVVIAAYFPLHFRLPAFLEWAPPLIAAAGLALIFARGIPDLGVAEWMLPEGAAGFLLEHQITGPIFNTYEQGGYLIWKLWPQQRVFIDGRSLSESVYRDYKGILFGDGSDRMTPARAGLLDHYGVQAVVMNTVDYVSGTLYPLALALANPDTPDWQLAYEDTQAVVFTRRNPPGTPVLANKFGHVLRHLDRECIAYLENAPENGACAATLANYWMHYGVKDAARRMLQLYIAHTPKPDPKAVMDLRGLMDQ